VQRMHYLVPLIAAVCPLPALAAPLEAPADIAWVCVAAALVFFMQAGFALLEGGFARAKNSTNVIMKNFADLAFGALAFWTVGFGLMFGINETGWFGASHFLPEALTGSQSVFLLFQAMFAATAATIVSGSVAERMRFGPYVIASIFITALIYPVFGSWVWGGFFGGGGWLAARGFVDFAGSTVVHSVGAWCALAGAIAVGPRLGRFAPDGTPRNIPGHNLPSIALGVFILWLGWFGFNGGSTLAANADVGFVLVNTHLAGAAGMAGTYLTLQLLGRPLLMTTTVNGAIAGLVAITAGCASMPPGFAILTGLVAAPVMVLGTDLLERLRIDDVVGAVPVHGFCGAWGTFAAGLFYAGDLFSTERVLVQLLGIGAALLWVLPTAGLVFWLLKRTIGLRTDTLHEQRGLDYTEHYEIGYPEFQKELLHGGKG
jgi:Amt family ammonium transporter